MADELKQAQRTAKQMSKAVRAWGDNELRRVMMKASRDSARVAVPYIQSYVSDDTGTLKRNIKPAGTRTVPKIRAGTKTRGGPYAWLHHHDHKARDKKTVVKGTQYVRKGVKEAYPMIRKTYIAGQRKSAKIFNARTERVQSRMERARI